MVYSLKLRKVTFLNENTWKEIGSDYTGKLRQNDLIAFLAELIDLESLIIFVLSIPCFNSGHKKH